MLGIEKVFQQAMIIVARSNWIMVLFSLVQKGLQMGFEKRISLVFECSNLRSFLMISNWRLRQLGN